MVIHQFVLQILHGLSQMHLRAVVDSEAGVLRLYHLQHLLAVHRRCRFPFLGLAEAGGNHLGNVLLLRELDVQLLDAGHLLIVEPVGCLLFVQLVHHLSIELAVVDVPYIIYILPVWNPDADIAATARCIRQGMLVGFCRSF